MYELACLNGWNWQSQLPALAEQTFLDHRGRESTLNQRALLKPAVATNLRSATHRQHSAKDDVAGTRWMYAALGSALTVKSAGAGFVYDWFDFTVGRSEQLLMRLLQGDTADHLRNLSLSIDVLALCKVLGLPIWANPVWRPAAAERPKLVLLPQKGHA